MGRLRDIGQPTLESFEDFVPWFQIFIEYFARVDRREQSLAPSSVVANTTDEQLFTVEKLDSKDVVRVVKPTHQAGIGIVNCRVTQANEIGITYMNTTGGAITPTTETYIILITRLGES